MPPMPSGKHRRERSHAQYRPDAREPALWRQNPHQGACRSPAVRGRKRCRMHGGAQGSGAPRANQNARKHGLFTRDAIAERRQIQTLLGKRGSCWERLNDQFGDARRGQGRRLTILKRRGRVEVAPRQRRRLLHCTFPALRQDAKPALVFGCIRGNVKGLVALVTSSQSVAKVGKGVRGFCGDGND